MDNIFALIWIVTLALISARSNELKQKKCVIQRSEGELRWIT